jgi:DNA-3-methyladenine glycosylase II
MATQKPRLKSLTGASLIRGISYLSKTDPDLARVVSEFGNPPLWAREPGFPTLVLIILEQQVSLASARAAFRRLQNAANPLSPRCFLDFDDRELKKIWVQPPEEPLLPGAGRSNHPREPWTRGTP